MKKEVDFVSMQHWSFILRKLIGKEIKNFLNVMAQFG